MNVLASKSPSFRSVEVLRAYMAWWVVFDHGFHLIGEGGTIKTNDPPFLAFVPHKLIALLTQGPTAVHVFMIISGFVITNLLFSKQEHYGAYITRRAFRLFPIYLLCLALALATMHLHRIAYIDNPFSEFRLNEINLAESEDRNFLTHLGLHITLLHGLVPNALVPYASGALLTPAWSLSLEWQFYLLAPLLIALLTSRGTIARWSCALVLTAVALLLARQDSLTWDFGSFFLEVSGYFVLGILCRHALEQHQSNKPVVEMLVLAAIVAIFLDKLAIAIWFGWSFILLIETGTLSLRSGILAKLVDVVAFSRFARQAGTWSFSTYLVHFPIYSVVIGTYGLMAGTANMRQSTIALLVVASLPVVLAASALLYRIVEAPGIKLGRAAAGSLSGDGRTG